MDKNLTNLLKWSIENSTGATSSSNDNNTTTTAAAASASSLNPEILSALFGGPSEAELMKAAMEVIQDPGAALDDKLTAFDNFEQLIESLDNANNLEPLSLWTPLVGLLSHPTEPELRRMAAWCVGTAVQNNARTQERLLAVGGLPPLVELALAEGEEPAVRKKAVYALSSAVRNYQPAMDVAVGELRKRGHEHGIGGAGEGGEKSRVDAGDMSAVDVVIDGLRKKVEAAAAAAAAKAKA
ncbi:hypothetical protein VTK26DRAFT_8078 [Humicola hyalothermophila]